MGYVVNGVELETDADGYLVTPDYGEEIVRVIAQAEGIELNDDHWKVVQYLRDQYKEHAGQLESAGRRSGNATDQHP